MALYFKDIEITNIDNLVPQIGLDITDIWFGNTNIYTVWVVYEGTLPAAFNANGADMRQYQIYGNTGGVGDRTVNVMPAGEKKIVVNSGITFKSDGSGCYRISGKASADASVNFNLASGFTTPISVSNGGQGTLSFFNNQSNENVQVIFYNGATMVDAWRMSLINRTNTAYNAIGNKYIDNVSISVPVNSTINMTIKPEFTNDGTLPTKFVPFGYEMDMSTSDGTNTTTTPIYIGDEPLGKDEYVDYQAGKIYRMINGTLTPTDPPVALPALPTCEGTTIVDYAGSGAAPEKVLLKYRKEGY